MDPCSLPYSFRYNGTRCACAPGRYYAPREDGGGCVLMEEGEWQAGSRSRGVGGGGGSSAGFRPPGALIGEVLPLDSVERVVSSEAVVVKATLILVLFWLAFCLGVRFGRVDRGRTIWFRIRWWIARLDLRFNTKHIMEDLKVVRKRKTELGGTFSVASWILFAGLLSALLYQVITRRSIEVHKVRPTNAPDLLSFINDMEFNITTISSMSCAHLGGPAKLVTGMPGSIYFKVSPLPAYANYTCYNTSRGPTVSLKCSRCKIPSTDHYISWQFIDLPGDPATAVGFQFNLSVNAHGDDRHVSFVSGTLKSGAYSDDSPQTFRGLDMNILKIHLFPQKFTYLDDLRLIQPLLHDFLPGSSFSEVNDLQESLQNPKDGLVNTTLYISYLSDYIVEIDKQKVVGIVSFLAEVGGLYTISLVIFLYLLLQCESRFKNLRVEDSVMRDIRRHKRAQRHWDTLRKYVNYTWGRSNLDMKSISRRHETVLPVPCCGGGSLHRLKHPSQRTIKYNDRLADIPDHVEFGPDLIYTGVIKSRIAGTAIDFDGILSHSQSKHEPSDIKDGKRVEIASYVCPSSSWSSER